MGMSRYTGKALGRREHIRQSIGNILTTPIGTRLMNREFGSLVPYMIDQPFDGVMLLRLMSASVDAITRFETRVTVTGIKNIDRVDARAVIELEMHDNGTRQGYSDKVNLRGGA